MKVAVSVVTFSKEQELVTELSRHFPEYSLNKPGRRLTRDELIDSLSDADAAIIGLDKIDEYVLKHCPKLKIIAKHGIGTDKIDFDACEKYGVEVRTQSGTNKRGVSELTLSFMLDLMRGGYRSSLQMREGNWDKYTNKGRSLTGKTIGIIGVGNVGKDLVSLLSPFNCRILVNDIREDKEQLDFYGKHRLEPSSKENIYRESNIITLHTSLTPLTQNMITSNEFSLMGKAPYLINTARGEIINISDTLSALREDKISGLALDVFAIEPPKGYPYEQLRSRPEVIFTSHIAGTDVESAKALGMTAISNLREYFGK